jgi:hypothetical protein
MNEENIEQNLAIIESLEKENEDLNRDIIKINDMINEISGSGLNELIEKRDNLEIEKQSILSLENYSEAYFVKHREQKDVIKKIEAYPFAGSDEKDLNLLKTEKEEKILANIEQIEKLNQEIS